jgi:lipopolysaccharide transport system ATP-binding protein
MDISRPIAIEMEFIVLQEGYELTPNYHFLNEQGEYVFVTADNDPAWLKRPRPAGCFVSTAWIPGNLLAEGTLMVGAALTTREPEFVHVFEREAIAFQVVDSMDGNSVRGDYSGHIPGVVRPLLQWDTRYTAEQCETVAGGTPR